MNCDPHASRDSSAAQIAQAQGVRWVYHLAHVWNLASILDQGLLSRRALDDLGVAAPSLQPDSVREARRRSIAFPDGSRAPLDGFVPLRWVARTPVLANLAYDWRAGCYRCERQEYLVVLRIRVEALDEADVLWCSTDNPLSKHARLIAPPDWATLPWDVIAAADTLSTSEPHPAGGFEILLDGAIDTGFVEACIVCSDAAAEHARFVAPGFAVEVKPDWFFGCEGEL